MKQLILICFLSISLATIGQNDDEYSRFANQYNADLKNFRDQYNAEFGSFVKQYWTEFELFKSKSLFSKPKPKEPIKIDSPPTIDVNEELRIDVSKKTPPKPNAILEMVNENDVSKVKDGATYNIKFCGETISINIPKDMIFTLKDISEVSVGEAWEKMSKANYLAMVHDCQAAALKMSLNDWGYFLLIKQIANGLFNGKKNESTVFTLFVMNQIGYDVRVGKINGDELILLAPFVQDVYELPYIQSDGNTYYVLQKNKEIKSVSTYKKSFVTAKHVFDLDLSDPLKLIEDLKVKNYDNDFGSNIKIEYNDNDITLYQAYPMCDLAVYCNAPVSNSVEKSLKETLVPMMKDMCQLEKINLVLEFIQAMPYKTDEEQFGYEKYFFPEEVFAFPYCDCEDRAALFRWIVVNIVGLEVINLQYDDHVAAAVKFTDNVNGDYVNYNNSKYIICDPTYIGAPAGLSMPQYKNVAAKIID